MGRRTLTGTRTTRDRVSTGLSKRPTRAFVGIQARDVPVLLLTLAMLTIGGLGNIVVLQYIFTGGLNG